MKRTTLAAIAAVPLALLAAACSSSRSSSASGSEWVAEPEAVLELELLHAAASRARGTAAIAASVVRFMCFSSGFDCQRAGGRERDHGPGVHHVARRPAATYVRWRLQSSAELRAAESPVAAFQPGRSALRWSCS